jgi:hypothetical protein
MAFSVRAAVLLGLLALPAQPAQAQGFWQPMFGYGSPPRAYHYPGMSPYRLPGLSPYGGAYSPYQPYRGGDESQPLERGGTNRTLCVRLCDGFYFPISSAATGGSLSRDAEACSASCGSEGRLFYHPNIGGDVETMVDLTGMAYSALPNAFKYRKTLVEGCRCRPQPWSETELQRHRAYAQGQSPATNAGAGPPSNQPPQPHAQDDPGAPRVAGIDRQVPSADDPHIVPRPPPIAREIPPAQPAWPYSSSGSSGVPKSKYIWPNDERDRY